MVVAIGGWGGGAAKMSVPQKQVGKSVCPVLQVTSMSW